jgi:hypothetical protein
MPRINFDFIADNKPDNLLSAEQIIQWWWRQMLSTSPPAYAVSP